MKLAVLISGGGSNLQALIDANLGVEISLVISNRKDAGGLAKAAKAGIKTAVVEHGHFDSRESFESALLRELSSVELDYIVLAGFMRVLTPVFITKFSNKILNIHPSLLPKYKGLNTHQRAIDAGDSYAGVSVHLVTNELDGGSIIAQAKVPVLPADTAEQLAARVLVSEHKLYPMVIAWLAEKRLEIRQVADYGSEDKVSDDKQESKVALFLDEQQLPEQGYDATAIL